MFSGITLKDLACHFAAQYRAARCNGETTFVVGALTATVNYDDYVYVVQLTEIDVEVRVNARSVECYERDYGVLSDVERAAALTYITDACRALAVTKAATQAVTALSDDSYHLTADVESRRVDVFYTV